MAYLGLCNFFNSLTIFEKERFFNGHPLYNVAEDCPHALLSCPYNNDFNTWIIRLLSEHLPVLPLENITTLNFDLDPDLLFPVVWLLSTALPLVWQLRQAKKTVKLFNIRADIEARVNLLRNSRLKDAATQIEELLNF